MNKVKQEWLTEEDRETWVDEETGYTCLILRHDDMLHLCGYVYVPVDHPWFKLEYGQATDDDSRPPELDLEVHGGCTFSGMHTENNENTEWCFGFDCAHLSDYSPGMAKYGMDRDQDTYRNWAYVKQQCEAMAKQLKRVAS